MDFDELQINFDFSDKHRESLTAAKLPVLLNLCQCLAKLGGSATGGGGGRSDNASRAVEHAGQAIELDATVRSTRSLLVSHVLENWFWSFTILGCFSRVAANGLAAHARRVHPIPRGDRPLNLIDACVEQ